MSEAKAPAAQGGSLAAYMTAQREARDSSTSERFPLPGFSAVEVELRPIDYKREFHIGETNRKKVKDEADQLLYTMADTLTRATIGFFVGDAAVAGQDNSWDGLALKAYPEASELTTRQAVIRLLTPDGVSMLYGQYVRWREARGADDLDMDLESTH